MSCISHETLARFAAGDMEAADASDVEAHIRTCAECRKRLEAIRKADTVLCLLKRAEPSAQALLNTRRLISEEIRAPQAPEIMTLDDVAEFLRIGPGELEEIAEELPAFELAGEIRVRRAKLLDWIEHRERQYMRQTIESRAARISRTAFQRGA